MKTSVLGYPRIGGNREWKFSLESYWRKEISQVQLEEQLKNLRLENLRLQMEAGIDFIPVGDFSYYDHVLDMAYVLKWIPKRFTEEKGLDAYFAMARGTKGAVASSLKKWFNTNYHYIVPEYEEDYEDGINENRYVTLYKEAKEELGIETKPVLVGPFTFLKLGKGYQSPQFKSILDQLALKYEIILSQLREAGVEWIQVDEPILTQPLTKEEKTDFLEIYERLTKVSPKIMLQTYFEAVEDLSFLNQLSVAGIGLDFVHGKNDNLRQLRQHGLSHNKVLGVGLIDGRNVWRSHLVEKQELLEEIKTLIPNQECWIQTSCSLLHVPVALEQEKDLPDSLKDGLAFGNEKLKELVLLKENNESLLKIYSKKSEQFKQIDGRNRQDILDAIRGLNQSDFQRSTPFTERYEKQRTKFNLPFLPTTTIGSFPQSKEVRATRKKWRTGEITTEQYQTYVKEEIARWIQIQEELELDILVHGEFERTDMVEFFGEKLDGFLFTKNGWVQSYGSRCVKPPIIYGDVAYAEEMTVGETVYAASLTDKPVKGMLTGPVTILNWSFVRDDQPRSEVAKQIAYALRQEVLELEEKGITMIQVDEPALREGLPLKEHDHKDYLDWAVNCFKLTTAGVKETTQIHTHMCYCTFEDILDSIEALDADVISIEASRGHGELIESFKRSPYSKGIGLGVYDIHSPRIPGVEEMKTIIEDTLQACKKEYAWVNPDCGLKTRNEKEVIESLRHLVEATKEVRKEWVLVVK